MNNIIVTTPEELRAIVSEAVAGVLPKTVSESKIDTITLSEALNFLGEQGYPTSKAKVYKLTATGDIPCKRYGNKLVFSRKELLSWAENQTKSKHNPSELALNLARSARRKMKGAAQ